MGQHRTPHGEKSTSEKNSGRRNDNVYIPYMPRHGKPDQPSLLARLLGKKKS